MFLRSQKVSPTQTTTTTTVTQSTRKTTVIRPLQREQPRRRVRETLTAFNSSHNKLQDRWHHKDGPAQRRESCPRPQRYASSGKLPGVLPPTVIEFAKKSRTKTAPCENNESSSLLYIDDDDISEITNCIGSTLMLNDKDTSLPVNEEMEVLGQSWPQPLPPRDLGIDFMLSPSSLPLRKKKANIRMAPFLPDRRRKNKSNSIPLVSNHNTI